MKDIKRKLILFLKQDVDMHGPKQPLTVVNAEKFVRGAWQVGATIIVLFILAGLAGSISKDTSPAPIYFATLFALSALTCGTYRKNKYAALLLFILVVSAIIPLIKMLPKSIGGLLFILYFSYFLFQGVRGAFYLAKQKSKLSAGSNWPHKN